MRRRGSACGTASGYILVRAKAFLCDSRRAIVLVGFVRPQRTQAESTAVQKSASVKIKYHQLEQLCPGRGSCKMLSFALPAYSHSSARSFWPSPRPCETEVNASPPCERNVKVKLNRHLSDHQLLWWPPPAQCRAPSAEACSPDHCHCTGP